MTAVKHPQTPKPVFTIGQFQPLRDPDDQYHYFCEQLNKNLRDLRWCYSVWKSSQIASSVLKLRCFQAVSDGSAGCGLHFHQYRFSVAFAVTGA